MSQLYHSIQTELMLDALNAANSAQAISELIDEQRKLQSAILQSIGDQHERELLLSLLRVNEGTLIAVQNLLFGLEKINAHLPELTQALRERRQRPMPATYELIAGELERVAREESLQVDVVMTPSRIPVLGGLLTRIKRAFHSLVLFYVQRLAWKQTQINRLQVQAILFLLQTLADQEIQRSKGLQDNQNH
ncbi:MAG: hypothetical protein QXS54_10975, partial [Candidatus Methanomethylicaceae archaeon]